jgi:Flp pilus assembly protein TadG
MELNRTSSRRGSSMLYLVAVMAVLMGFASLAVDYGRVQMVKTQLQIAVDAATRAAAGRMMAPAEAIQIA